MEKLNYKITQTKHLWQKFYWHFSFYVDHALTKLLGVGEFINSIYEQNDILEKKDVFFSFTF